MTTQRYATSIEAAPKTVWDTMLGDPTYRQWTAEFTEGSYFEGSWEQGERIRFLAPNGEGMVAVIAENRPYEFISIRHLGVIKDGVEDTDSDEVRAWAPAYENYTLSPDGVSTRLEVTIEVTPDAEEFMARLWPRALSRLKALCEAGGAGATSRQAPR